MVPVTSGVPQGSQLGPILFLAYINDLPQDIVSQVSLFADVIAIYLTLENKGDSGELQKDLDRLPTWEARWDMEVKSMQRSGIEEIRTKIKPPKPKTGNKL